MCNVRGLNSKYDSVLDILVNLSIDIFLINETWIKGKELDFEGYHTFYKNRTNGRGGGIATLIRKNNHISVEVVCESNSDCISEWQILKITCYDKIVFIVNVYGP